MAATWSYQADSLLKTVFGNQRVVFGALEATGTYTSNGDDYDIATVTDGFITTESFPMRLAVGHNGSTSFYLALADDGKILIFGSAGAASHTHTFTSDAGGTGATGAEAAHTHTIAVTAGTAGDAVTNNAGVLNSTGGQDLTTSAGSSHTHTGPSHTHTGTTAAGSVSRISTWRPGQVSGGTRSSR